MKRALFTSALALALGGCSAHHATHQPAPKAAAAESDARVDRFAEIDVEKLPRGVFPPWHGNARGLPPAAFSRTVPGIYVNAAPDPPRISGVNNDDDLLAIEIKDTADSASAYCLAYAASRGQPEQTSIGLVTQTMLPLLDDPFAVRAERIVDEPGGRTHFELMRGVVSERRGFARAGQGTAPLRRLAAYQGVEVFAFVDDSTERTSASVDFVIRRPPIRHAAVRYAAFIARLPDGRGAAGSCSHIRVSLPIEPGDAASASVDVGVETGEGARRLRVQLGALWLSGAPTAKAIVRLDWRGPELEVLSLPDPEGIDELATAKRRRSR
jgi:hypothetical protein